MTTDNNDNVTPDAEPVQAIDPIQAAQTALATAQASLASARDAVDASRTGDIDSMVKAAAEYKAAQGTVEKAENAVRRAMFEANGEARAAVAIPLKDAFLALFNSAEMATYVELGGTATVQISRDDKGEAVIALGSTMSAKAPSAPRAEGSGGGTRKGGNTWEYAGQTYTSRELLSQFGDAQNEAGWTEKVFERAANGAGFDAPVKTLAKKLGAIGRKGDGSLIDLG